MSSRALVLGLWLLQLGLEEGSIVVAPSPFFLLNDAMKLWTEAREWDFGQLIGVL